MKGKTGVVTWFVPLLAISGMALGQVTVKKDMPPTMSLRVEDLCSATITSREARTVWMKGTADEASRGRIAWATTARFQVRAGTTRFDAAHLPPLDQTWVAPEFEGRVRQTGTLPEGDYLLYIQVFDENGTLLDEDRLRHRVRYPQLRLIAPPDGSRITDPHPLFQWSLSGPLPGAEHELSLYEVVPGQTPEDAVHNIPFFRESRTGMTSLQYPVGGKALERGRKYCWQVRTLAGGVAVLESEIRAFRLGTPGKRKPKEIDHLFVDVVWEGKRTKIEVNASLKGKPVAGARILVRDLRRPAVRACCTTDGNGQGGTSLQGQVVDALNAIDEQNQELLDQVIDAANAVGDDGSSNVEIDVGEEPDSLDGIDQVKQEIFWKKKGIAVQTWVLDGGKPLPGAKIVLSDPTGSIEWGGQEANLSGTGGVALLEYVKDAIQTTVSNISGVGTREIQMKKIVERRMGGMDGGSSDDDDDDKDN